MSEIKSITDQEILSYWDSIKSVRGVAIKLGISWQRVIKSLSSLGIIVNNTHAKITQYHKEGKSANEIADLMNMNVNVVKAYLPRNRPQYKVNQSKNALAVQRSKERHKIYFTYLSTTSLPTSIFNICSFTSLLSQPL